MNPFEDLAARYDNWFDRHDAVYTSELNAIQEILATLPPYEHALEIGTGTGRFSTPFGISDGVEPVAAMRAIARQRGLNVVEGYGESLPYASGAYDLVLLVTAICFVKDPQQVFHEARRVLKADGALVTGFVDRESFLGKKYEAHRDESPFYRDARFYSVADLCAMMTTAGFNTFEYRQTLFRDIEDITTPETAETGYGKGGFVVICAKRNPMEGPQ